MIIYLIRNRITGKGYVGQTINSLEMRWYGHRYCAKKQRNLAIDNAIHKYGEKNFERIVLASADSSEELNELENHYIRLYGTLAPDGYNVHTGGQNHICSEETKRKIGAASKGRQTTLGFKFSKESRIKMSLAKKGKKLSKEHIHNRTVAQESGKVESNRKRSETMKQIRASRFWSTRSKPEEFST